MWQYGKEGDNITLTIYTTADRLSILYCERNLIFIRKRIGNAN